ncbi:MAG: putative pyridoxal-dependent aspartate 1-decarboxylase, partial [bacterium]|nr:putative pyridoxal-dependent aspartate 1-decarboxylase [bacterium]
MNINNKPGEQGNSRPIKDIIEEYFQTTPNSENMKDFQQGIAACIESFVNSPCITSNFKLDQLSYQFKNSVVPEKPLMSTAYIQYLKEKVLPHSVNVGNRQYIGHMTSQLPLFFQYISQLITLMNQNVVKVETSKVYTLIERQTIAMLHRLVYELPDSFYNENVQKRESNLGIITSCGTLANITALWIARNSALQSSDEFLGLQSEGFVNALKHYGYKDAVIIGSAKMHYSMDKLGSLIGLGAENIIKIGLNKNGAININKLKRAILECKREKRLVVAIVGIAGATETGQIDDLV